MNLYSFFIRNPLKRMTLYRDRADRAAIAFLEAHAVKGTITRTMIGRVAEAVNRDPRHLIRMIPDLRRARRYEKAMAGLRTAGLLEDYHGDDLIER